MQTRWYEPPRKSHSRAEWSDEPQARQTACMAKEFNDELKFDQFIQKKGIPLVSAFVSTGNTFQYKL